MVSREGTYVRVDLLGPIEVWLESGPVPLPRGRVQVALALLALAGGRPVSAAALVERVWGERMPRNPTASLTTLVHRLRNAVGTDAVQNTPNGYALVIEPSRVDVLRFRRLIGDAELTDDTATARALLEDAIRLWRGEPLADIGAFAHDEIPRLVEEYLTAQERRIALELAAGRHAAAVVTLHELTARYPLRETLWHQLIEAQARAGRQADALSTYETVRRQLAEELGVDPSAELRALHQRLVRGEPPVDLAEQATPSDAADPAPLSDTAPISETPPTVKTPLMSEAPPNTLPGDIADLTGREDELAAITGLVGVAERTVVIAAIDGMGGVGKTMIAVRAAHRLAGEFPGGQLFIDLYGHTPGREPMRPAEALGSLLRAMGVVGSALPQSLDELAGLWRSTVAGRRVLVVLDNAASAEQVRALVPGTAGCVVLVTSRRRLVDLDTTRTVSVRELEHEPSADLFASVVGRERADAEPDAVAEVLALCGYLPLAIRIAAARLRARPAWRVAYLAERLRGAHSRSAELAAGDRDVAATLAVSYHHLTADGRRMFRLLGLVPGPTIDGHAAAALAGVAVSQVETMLADLVDAHLVGEVTPGRFQLHDLLREQAHRVAIAEEPATDRAAAELRLLDYYLALAGRGHAALLDTAMPPWIEPLVAAAELPDAEDYPTMLARLQAERTNLLAAADWAADTGRDQHAARLPYALGYFLDLCGYSAEAADSHLTAVEAATRIGDDPLRAGLLSNLASIQFSLGRFAAALEAADRAYELMDQLDDAGGVGRSLNNAGNALYRMGRYAEALDRYQHALALVPDEGTDVVAPIVVNLAIIELRLDHVDSARHYADRALAAAAEMVGDRYLADALGVHGSVEWRLGNLDNAERAYTQAQQVAVERSDLAMQAAVGNDHGVLERIRGRYAAAVGRHARALRLVRRLGHRAAETETLNDLGTTLLAAGHPSLAAAAHRAAVDPAHTSTNRYELARAFAGIAESAGPPDRATALRYASEAARIFDELGLPDARRLSELSEALHSGLSSAE